MNIHVRRLVAVAATGLVLLGSVGIGTAAAATHWATLCTAERIAARANPTVPNYQAVGNCEIDRRLATISTLQGGVTASLTITSADKAALGSELSASAAGLTALRATIDADTTVDQIKTDIPKIFSDYRIYLLVARQVALVRGADTVTATAAKLVSTADQLDIAIDAAHAAGKDTTKAEADLAAMNTAVASAATDRNGLSATILALTPAQWNAGTAGPVLNSARATIRTAHGQLVAALRDARKVLADIH